MNNYRRFKFVKPLKVKEGEFPIGAEITVLGNRLYYNGGMLHTQYYSLILDLLEYEAIKGPQYLREIPIPYNKL